MRIALRLTIYAVLAALAAGLVARADANVVGDMRVIGDATRTRFVVDLEKSPEYGLKRLSNPYRLVIDLPDVAFGQPERPGEGRGLISDYRYGLIAPGKARIVLDLGGPVEIVNTFVLDPISDEPSRLVVDMVPTSEDAFQAAALKDRSRESDADLEGDASASAKEAETGLPIVVIDPGHGGIDSGAIGKDKLLEKDITLKFGLELARQIEAGGKLQAILTRKDDTFLSLSERMEVGRRHHAALFISIHADTVREDYVRGATVYTLSEDASDALAEALAERENRSDILAGLSLDDQPDDVADILFDLARRETKNFSVRFAKSLVEDMRGEVKLNTNPWRRASFKVLKAPEVPSVLLELGYLSNPDDEALFKSEKWPAVEARSVARAVEEFLIGRPTAGQ
jgi:N-acetylmuramoyl-L-alanine amidase